MPRSLLSTLTVLSLIALAVLALGCFTQFGVAYLHNVFTAPNPHGLDIELELEQGRVAIYWETWNNPPPGMLPAGTHFFWRPMRYHPQALRRAFWEFDAHPLNVVGGPSRIPLSGVWVFLLAFPIWCAALPCLIPPIIWLRRRQARHLPAFPIIPTTKSKSP